MQLIKDTPRINKPLRLNEVAELDHSSAQYESDSETW